MSVVSLRAPAGDTVDAAEPASAIRAGDPLAILLEACGRLKLPPDRLLGALVEIDPRGAAEYMVEHPGALTETVAPEHLSRLLDRLASNRHLPSELRSALVESYPNHLSGAGLDAVHAAGTDLSTSPPLQRRLTSLLAHQPGDPTLLRLAAEVAVMTGAHADADRLLTRWGRADPTAATVRRIQRFRAQLPLATGPEVRIALLSSFTVDVLAAYLDLECRDLGLTPSIYLSPYNQWAQETFGDDPPYLRGHPEIVVLAVALDDLIPALGTAMPVSERAALGDSAIERIAGAVERIRSASTAAVVVHSLYTDEPSPTGTPGDLASDGRAAWIDEMNRRLADRLNSIGGAYLLDVRECLLRRSGGRADAPNLRHVARIRWSDSATAAVAAGHAGYIAPLKGMTRKCVVVDLDNTLWGGIVGEDGQFGIRLGATAPGSEFVEFQRYLKSLSSRGFLLAVASKNNPADALGVIREHESMILREEDFAAIRINWLPKPDNLASIAEELSLGLDALVFLDDNPHERALVRQALPQVLTPELPADPTRYREVVAQLPQLRQLAITGEDRARAAQYRTRQRRDQARFASVRHEDYLLSLELSVRIEPVGEPTLLRVHQLFQRTNQFNTTTRRYTLDELRRFIAAPEWHLFALAARDTFGDHGIVAAALAHAGPDVWELDSFLLSCRVIGHGVEGALLARVAAVAQQSHAAFLDAEFRHTEKNRPAADFYAHHAFDPVSGDESASRWRLDLGRICIVTPAWIRVDHGT